jgi:molybdopterin molybdotransferase
MISVAEAQARILAAFQPLPGEMIGLTEGLGRVLASDVIARVTQPPVAISAMDGYAVRAADVVRVPAILHQVGEAPAGGAYAGTVRPGEAVRIFTGAPVPDGADTIVIQENTDVDGARITVKEIAKPGSFIRPVGLDFTAGAVGLSAGRLLTARDIGLAASRMCLGCGCIAARGLPSWQPAMKSSCPAIRSAPIRSSVPTPMRWPR